MIIHNQFILMKFIVNETEINCSETDTILELKKEVINQGNYYIQGKDNQ